MNDTQDAERIMMTTGRQSAPWMPPVQRAFGALLAVALVAVTGCDGLLDVEGDWKTVDASKPVGLDEMMVGATTDLFQSYDSKIVWADGLFGDEMNSVGTDPTIINIDRRIVLTTTGGGSSRERSIGGGNYVLLQRATFVASAAQERILNGDFEQIAAPYEDSREYARVSMYDGFAKTWLSDMYCTVAFDGHGPEYTSAEVYALAEAQFTRAIEAANAEPEIVQAARVGRARVRLILGDEDGALADAQQVDPEFEFHATYSTNSFPQRNRVHFRTWDWSNFGIDLGFVGLTLDDTGVADPRVGIEKNPSPAREPTLDLYAPMKVPTAASPLRIATGDEAQYIIAEILGGDAAVTIINEIRARKGIDIEWTPAGGDPDEIRDKLIDERRRTLFLDGVRLGDLRRYLDKYGLDFFSTSVPHGGEMGDQTCWPLPDIERDNNPDI